MERRLKQIHVEMKALRNKEASGIRLGMEERSRLQQLAAERDKLAFALPARSRLEPRSDIRDRVA